MVLAGQCPDCGHPFGAPEQPARGYCPRCGLALTGELADDLDDTYAALARLDEQRAQLAAQYQNILARLQEERAQRSARESVPPEGRPAPAGEGGSWPSAAAPEASAEPPRPGAAPTGPPPDASLPSVKAVLLILGGVLLAVAAIVFTVVSWGSLGVGGRAAVLGTVTGVALAIPAWLARRLRDTAETVAVLGVVLLLLDAYAIWALDLGGVRAFDPSGYASAALAAICVMLAGYAAVMPLRLPLPIAVVLAQAPMFLAADALDATFSGTALAWALTATLDLGIYYAAAVRAAPESHAGRTARAVTRVTAAATGVLAWGASVVNGLQALAATMGAGGTGLAWAHGALAAPAAVAFGCAAIRPAGVSRHLAAGLGTAALATGGVHAATELTPPGWDMLALTGVAAVVTVAAALAPPWWRWGPLTTGAALTAGAGAWAAALVVAAALGPLLWGGAPWDGAPPHARAALSPLWEWPGLAEVLPVTALAAAALAAAAWRTFGRTAAAATGFVGAVAAGVVAPVALDLPYPAALTVLAVLAVALLAMPVALDRPAPHYAGAAFGLGVLATTVGWSLAEHPATLTVLGAFTVVVGCGAAVTRAVTVRAGFTIVTVALAGGQAAASALAAGWPARHAAFGVFGVAAVALGVAVLVRHRRPEQAVTLRVAAYLTGLVAVAMTLREPTTLAVSLAMSSLVTIGAATGLSRHWRARSLAGACVHAGLALVVVAVPLFAAWLGPLAWVSDPWSGAPRAAAAALTPHAAWPVQPVGQDLVTALPLVLGLLVTAIIAAAWLHGGRRWAVRAATLAVPLAAVPIPLVLGAAYVVALFILAGLASALAAAAVREELGGWAAVPALGIGAVTVAWSLAEQAPTLACLGLATLVALGCAVLARGPGVGASGSAVTALAAGGLAAAALLAAGVPARWAAFGVLTVAGGAVAVAALLHRFSGSRRARSGGTPPGATLGEVGGPFHGIATEGAASVLAVAAVAMTARHGTPLSLALAGTGLLAMATALRRDRRGAAYAGACLLLVATWVQLATRQVTAPEAYTVPLSALALLLGWLRRRQRPHISSWLAYAPGLVVTLPPSLVAVWPDAGWIRAVPLGTAALAVTLVGARARLQAPLLIGGAVVAALAGRELTPFLMELVAAVPRWVPLALGGLVLLFAGATYERRLQDVRRLHGYISSMQ